MAEGCRVGHLQPYKNQGSMYHVMCLDIISRDERKTSVSQMVVFPQT